MPNPLEKEMPILPRISLAVPVAALALFALALPLPAWAAEKVRIVAAENFYGDLAGQIGGDHVQVTSIISNPDDDPHLFEATPSTARELATAAIVIYNGADYDPWMKKLLSSESAPVRTVLIAAELTGHKSGENPHIWYDTTTFPAVATALAAELEKRDPADADTYRANLARFNTSFAAAIAGIAAIRTAHAGTKVTATEPVFNYMAKQMGLVMLNDGFQLSMMNETEPSPREVAAFENSLTSGAAKMLFYNSQVTDATTTHLLAIAKKNGVPVIGVTETEPANETIQSWFSGQIAAVAAALKGKS